MAGTKDNARRDDKRRREAFARVRNAEQQYAIQLRKVARQIQVFIEGLHVPGGEVLDLTKLPVIVDMLRQYSDVLAPWARSVALRMLTDVSQRDERAWVIYTQNLSSTLRRELQNAPTGEAMRSFLATQVHLIKSLPLEAAQRVHDLTQEALVSGARHKEIAAKILETGRVTKSSANLIARDGVSRTASTLTMVRAQSIGSEGYFWLTSKDADVRPTHKKMEGKFCRFDTPPLVERNPNKHYHAGMIYNCRCTMLPVVPERFFS